MSADRLAEVRNRKIGFVFQSFNLLPRTSAPASGRFITDEDNDTLVPAVVLGQTAVEYLFGSTFVDPIQARAGLRPCPPNIHRYVRSHPIHPQTTEFGNI